MEIIEPDAAEPDGIQVGRIQDRVPVKAQIAIPLVIGNDQQQVGRLLAGVDRQKQSGQQKREK
jgi:hypothetical protein